MDINEEIESIMKWDAITAVATVVAIWASLASYFFYSEIIQWMGI